MKDILEGIRLFNESDFFSAHDFFEELWAESDREDRYFFQGLVQISVGCYHLISGNLRGCLSQFKKGNEKLISYLPIHKNVNVKLLVSDIELIIKDLSELSSDRDLNLFWNRIPRIKTDR